MRNMRNMKTTILVLTAIFATALFAGCSGGLGNAGGEKGEIIAALQRDYPPDKKADGETSDYELFKYELLDETPKEAEKGWCVNFLFTNKKDASSKPERWIGFGNVVKKGDKYSYEFSQGCELSDAEQKKVFELKNEG